MNDMILDWWQEIKGNTRVDEVSQKEFMRFAIKKKIIVDEKELESLFKDLSGDHNLVDKVKKADFMRLFIRPCFKGALQNVYDFIEKSTIILKNLPISVKIL